MPSPSSPPKGRTASTKKQAAKGSAAAKKKPSKGSGSGLRKPPKGSSSGTRKPPQRAGSTSKAAKRSTGAARRSSRATDVADQAVSRSVDSAAAREADGPVKASAASTRTGARSRPSATTRPARVTRLRRKLRPRSTGGVAPFVPPSRRAKTAWSLRRLQRRGFVPLTPGRPKLRHRILPRSVIGIATMLLAFGIGAAFSGATFYAYYDTRLAENEETVARFVEGFDQQFNDATGTIDQLRLQAVDDIRSELSPLGDYVDDANGVIGLPVTAGPSVWHLQTRDEDGKPVNGAAFAVAAHDGGTAFVTSYSLIISSLTTPNPPIELVKDEERLTAQLWTWDAELDVAIVVVDADIPPLPLATADEQVASVGARTFALSGVGGQGATASPGVLLDQSRSGLQHTAPVGSLFVGGPLLNGAGKVVGVSSLDYQPHGLDPGRVLAAPDVPGICQAVLACAETAIEGLAVDIPAPRPEGPPAPLND